MTEVLRAVDLHKSFVGEAEEIRVLEGVNLDVRQGEIVSVVGASGVGKSTLLHLLGGLDRPTSGTVIVDSQDLFSGNDGTLAAIRSRSVGFVFQFHHLLREFSALENVMIPALIAGRDRQLSRARAEVWHRRDHRPARLSGGEQQRVAVARALVNEPKVILADEPSGNLDRGHSRELHDLIWELRRSQNQAFVIATHDLELAERADRTTTLADGRLREEVRAEG
jgi:lipoprotein-releasing system ATP-binding protein